MGKCLDSLLRTGTAFLNHQECYQSHLVPMGVMGHLGPSLSLALRWAGVSTGRWEQENGLDKAWQLPATTHTLYVRPNPMSPVPSLRSWERATRQHKVPGLQQPRGYPAALFLQPHPSIQSDLKQPLPAEAPFLQPHTPLQQGASQLQRYSHRWYLSFLRRVGWAYKVVAG